MTVNLWTEDAHASWYLERDLSQPLADVVAGPVDAVVSSFAIHHLDDERKRSIYEEVFGLLRPGGVFANLEHVASPSRVLHERFLELVGVVVEEDDPSNQLLDVATQVRWLDEIGFVDADCYWKWREMALLAGVKPT